MFYLLLIFVRLLSCPCLMLYNSSFLLLYFLFDLSTSSDLQVSKIILYICYCISYFLFPPFFRFTSFQILVFLIARFPFNISILFGSIAFVIILVFYFLTSCLTDLEIFSFICFSFKELEFLILIYFRFTIRFFLYFIYDSFSYLSK